MLAGISVQKKEKRRILERKEKSKEKKNRLKRRIFWKKSGSWPSLIDRFRTEGGRKNGGGDGRIRDVARKKTVSSAGERSWSLFHLVNSMRKAV